MIGITPSNSGDDTAAVQAAINAATGGDEVVFDSGVYDVDPLVWGDGSADPPPLRADGVVTLRARGSGAILNFLPSYPVVRNAGAISGIRFSGNGVGTNALALRKAWNLHISDCQFAGFTGYAAQIEGCIYGQMESCRFLNTQAGVYGLKSSLDNTQPNLFHFSQCRFEELQGSAVEWLHGAGVRFESCGFERCALANVNYLYVVRLANACPSNEGVAASFVNCWWERNGTGYEKANLGLPVPDTRSRFSLDDCLMVNVAGSNPPYGIVTANSSNVHLITRGGAFKGATKKDVLLGSGVTWDRYSTVVGTTSGGTVTPYGNAV